jgi:PKD repeat protein
MVLLTLTGPAGFAEAFTTADFEGAWNVRGLSVLGNSGAWGYGTFTIDGTGTGTGTGTGMGTSTGTGTDTGTGTGTGTAAAPVADFTADVTADPPPLTVNFTDNSSGNITSWEWDFGDGVTSTEQNPSHTYNDLGRYTVSLTVTGPGGSDTETKPDYITAAIVVVIPKDGYWASAINALQPGDIGQLEAGCYLGGGTITVRGTPENPIIIRGAGHLESIFDGDSRICALRMDNCSNLIIENITVTNPSPIGIDGRENYSSLARNPTP